MSKNINQDKVDPKLLEILVCPVTKSDLQYDSKNNELISKQACLLINSLFLLSYCKSLFVTGHTKISSNLGSTLS